MGVIFAHAWTKVVIALIDIAGVIAILLFRVARQDIHDFGPFVHIRGTVSILHSDPDEALVAPAGAPGVLDDPVRLYARLIQADNYDGVIHATRAVVILGEDAFLIETPAVVASAHSDANGSILDFALHVGDIIQILESHYIDLRLYLLAILVSAVTVHTLVLVSRVGLGADF